MLKITAVIGRNLIVGIVIAFLASPAAADMKVPGTASEYDFPLALELVWHAIGIEEEQISVSGQAPFNLIGSAFESDPIKQKLPESIIAYYSPDHLLQNGWHYLGDSAGALTVVRTFFQSPNRYLTVRIGSCIAFISSQAPDTLAPSADNCLRVWISDPAVSAPTPPATAFALPPSPEPNSLAPASVSYPNLLVVPRFSQNDHRWYANQQGWSLPANPTACNYSTLGYVDNSHFGYGCWTTSYAMLYNYYQPNYTDPGSLNGKLNSGTGGGPRYAGDGSGCNNLMPGGTPYAPTGISRGQTYYNYCATTNCIDPITNTLLIDNELLAGHPLLVYVHYSGVSPQHMVVITGHSGNTYSINDPWNGVQATLAYGGIKPYVVDWIYVWHGTPPGPQYVFYLPLISHQ